MAEEVTHTPKSIDLIPASETLASLYYTRGEVLQLLDGISDKTLERLEQKGKGPPKSLLPGRRVRYRKTSFHQWLEAFEQAPRPARRRRRARALTRARTEQEKSNDARLRSEPPAGQRHARGCSVKYKIKQQDPPEVPGDTAKQATFHPCCVDDFLQAARDDRPGDESVALKSKRQFSQ
jgi:hypothetical protein